MPYVGWLILFPVVLLQSDILPVSYTFPYTGNGIDCLLDGVQRELWATSHNCSKCCFSQLEG